MTGQGTAKPTALIIGAGSGMGAATAARFHADGWQLVLADVGADRVAGAAARFGAQAAAVDVTDAAAIDRLAGVCAGGIDALVITAGLSMSMAGFDRIMDVNLVGSAQVLARFLGLVRPGGAVVCLASIAGHMAGALPAAVEAIIDDPLSPDFRARLHAALGEEACIPGMAYALSKLGVLRLVQRSAMPFGRTGVRVCSVSPGVIETPMGELERKSNAGAEDATALAPIPRLGGADEVAAVIAFLCSPAASYVTGTDLIVDGGWIAEIRSSANSPIALAMTNARAKS